MTPQAKARPASPMWVEIVLGGVLVAISLACAAVIVLMFEGANFRIGRWLPAGLFQYAFVGLAAILGYTFGKNAQDPSAAEEAGFAEAWSELAEIASRRIESGSPQHVAELGRIAGSADAARAAAIFAADALWRAYDTFTREESPRGEATAQAISQVVQFRRLEVSIPGLDPLQLDTGASYTLEMCIAPPPGSTETPALVPDFGPSGSVSIMLQIDSSANVRISPTRHRFKLPAVGSSESLLTSIEVLQPGECELHFLVALEPAMDLLQEYRAVIPAALPQM